MSNFFTELFEFFINVFKGSNHSDNVLTDDEKQYIKNNFKPSDQAAVIKTLEKAQIPADLGNGHDRLFRSALVGSNGSLKELERLAVCIKEDFRDVIVAGEYAGDSTSANPTRLYDLNKPFGKDGKPSSAR